MKIGIASATAAVKIAGANTPGLSRRSAISFAHNARRRSHHG